MDWGRCILPLYALRASIEGTLLSLCIHVRLVYMFCINWNADGVYVFVYNKLSIYPELGESHRQF